MPFKPGDKVIYHPSHVKTNSWNTDTELYENEERGVVSSLNGKFVFVRFGDQSTAKAVDPRKLIRDRPSGFRPSWAKVM